MRDIVEKLYDLETTPAGADLPLCLRELGLDTNNYVTGIALIAAEARNEIIKLRQQLAAQ